MLKKILFHILPVIYAFSVNAQEVKRDLGPFSKLVVGDKIIVRLVKAEKESAWIQAQGIDETAVKTEVSDGTLKLSIYGETLKKKKVTITLNFVTLTDITVMGGADVSTASLFKADKLNVDLKSGGMLYLDADINKISGKLVEGSLLTAKGYAETMDMVVATAASLSAYELECDQVNIKVSSGGKAKIYAEETLNAEASSKGYISYKGDPEEVNQNATSGGTISRYQP